MNQIKKEFFESLKLFLSDYNIYEIKKIISEVKKRKIVLSSPERSMLYQSVAGSVVNEASRYRNEKDEQSFEKTYHIINAMKKIGIDFSIENIEEYNSTTFIIEDAPEWKGQSEFLLYPNIPPVMPVNSVTKHRTKSTTIHGGDFSVRSNYKKDYIVLFNKFLLKKQISIKENKLVVNRL